MRLEYNWNVPSPLSFSLEDQNFATFTESGLVAVGLVCKRLIATAMIA